MKNSMKAITNTVFVLLSGGALLGGSLFDPLPSPQVEQEKDAQEEAVDERTIPPFRRYRLAEKKRIEEALEGGWILMDFTDPNNPLEESVFDGWVSFHEGYMTLLFHFAIIEPGFLGEREQRYYQMGTYRYQLSEELYLQTATLMGSSNWNPEGEIEREPSGFARELQIEIADDELTLTNRNLIRFQFRRVRETEFPLDAVRELQRTR